MQKLFVISDIHGHFTVMKKALQNAGFDQHNTKHHLLCLGDFFDRGNENDQVYTYLKSLHDNNKASFILGNHDVFLIEFLEGNFQGVAFNAAYNGFDKTLENFSGIKYSKTNIEKMYHIIHKQYPSLLQWLNNLPLYIEHEDYIFTHGGIDLTLDDWRNQPRESFVWNYQSTLQAPSDKTVVVGHERTPMIRQKWMFSGKAIKGSPSDSTIIFDDHVIYIDAFVERTKLINVLTIDLESPLNKKD